MRFKFVIATLLAIFVSGCGGSGNIYVSEVSSFGDANKRSYILLPVRKDINRLEFNEYSKYLHRALQTNGFRRSIGGLNKSEIVIFIDYGIGDKHIEYETVSVRSAPRMQPVDYSRIPEGGVAAVVARQAGERMGGAFNTRNVRVPINVHKRFLNIYAVANSDNSPNPKHPKLWATRISSTGESGDLRKVMPYMVTAAEEYIGKNTNQNIEVTIGSENKRVKRIKGELKVKEPSKDKSLLSGILDVF